VTACSGVYLGFTFKWEHSDSNRGPRVYELLDRIGDILRVYWHFSFTMPLGIMKGIMKEGPFHGELPSQVAVDAGT
jgi:hypothetical protein